MSENFRRTGSTFAAIRSLRDASKGVRRPRAIFAFRLLKQVKVKGGRSGRLCVAPAYGRQFERFLSVS